MPGTPSACGRERWVGCRHVKLQSHQATPDRSRPPTSSCSHQPCVCTRACSDGFVSLLTLLSVKLRSPSRCLPAQWLCPPRPGRLCFRLFPGEGGSPQGETPLAPHFPFARLTRLIPSKHEGGRRGWENPPGGQPGQFGPYMCRESTSVLDTRGCPEPLPREQWFLA